MQQVVADIEAAAIQYKDHLSGKKFLYVFEKQYIEVIFKQRNFRHLTGVQSTQSAVRFYKDAVNGKLQAAQISFNDRHPFDLYCRKIGHFSDLTMHTGTDCFMLEEVRTNTRSFRFSATDLNFSVMFNRELDKNGKEKEGCFVAESLRDGDCFSKSSNAYVVDYIFSKDNSSKLYTEMLFCDDKADEKKLPEEVKELLTEKLLHNLMEKSGVE